ncbi:hypothetical protein ABTJ44_19455, partial [Acinetobacter baumannii]
QRPQTQPVAVPATQAVPPRRDPTARVVRLSLAPEKAQARPARSRKYKSRRRAPAVSGLRKNATGVYSQVIFYGPKSIEELFLE